MTADEPMSTPDSGGLREAVEALVAEYQEALDASSMGAHDRPSITFVVTDLARLLAAHPEPVPTPDSAHDATVGEREHVWPCPHFYAGMVAYDPGRRCTCPPATPPADDANRAPVSGGLDEGEREALRLLLRKAARDYCGISEGEYWPSTIADAQADALTDWLAARDAAWAERLAAVEGERDRYKDGWRVAFNAGIFQQGRAEAAEAERDTARREAGERIAVAIEADRDAYFENVPESMRGVVGAWIALAARIARADALTSDDGSGA